MKRFRAVCPADSERCVRHGRVAGAVSRAEDEQLPYGQPADAHVAVAARLRSSSAQLT